MADIRCDDSLIIAPVSEPLDRAETKQVLRFTSTSEDVLIQSWIVAARQMFEEQTGRQIRTATWERWLDRFPVQTIIELPHPPLQDVESVEYLADGAYETLDEDLYTVVAPAGPHAGRGSVQLNYGASWPTVVQQPKAVKIRYTAGWPEGSPDPLPEVVKATLYFLVGHFHRHRSETTEVDVKSLPLGAQMLMQAFKWSAKPQHPPLTTV